MMSNPSSDLNPGDLSDIRDAVPTLDLFAIRSLSRAGFRIIRQDRPEQDSSAPAQRPGWQSEPQATRSA